MDHEVVEQDDHHGRRRLNGSTPPWTRLPRPLFAKHIGPVAAPQVLNADLPVAAVVAPDPEDDMPDPEDDIPLEDPEDDDDTMPDLEVDVPRPECVLGGGYQP